MNKRRWRFVYLNNEKTKYKVSSDGKVKNTETGKFLSTKTVDRYGYVQMCLSHNSKHYVITLHRLVGRAFLAKPASANQINHIDGNKKNNNVENLEWCDGKYNVAHAYRTGLHDNKPIGERHGNNKYTEKSIRKVCELLANSFNYTLDDITKETGVPKSTIHDILSKKYWTHISKSYEIDNYYKKKPTSIYEIYRGKINRLAKRGFSSSEIRKELKLPYTTELYSIISYAVKQAKKNRKK
jgi:uncharacterized protein YerC